MYSDRLLVDYLPTVLKEYREYQALMFAEQPEIFQVFEEIQIALNNQFILSSNEIGVKRWEKMYNIALMVSYTLDERKFAILAKQMEQLPYTHRRLEQILEQMCGTSGYQLEVDTENYIVKVKIALAAKNKFSETVATLRRVCPADMIVDVSLLYNQHVNLGKLTHAQLSEYTHDQLRNEVI